VSFEVFNAGGDANNFTKRMIVEAIAKRIPAARIRYGESGGDPRNYRVDFARIRERLHFEPRHSVGDGIAEIADAMDQSLFVELDGPPSLFGNYAIENTTER
jgi:nucleoside-diphosphate-sugar epimerase